jgi:hypothetical protein
MGRACGAYGGGYRCAQGVGGGGLRERGQLGRQRRRWEDNFKMNLQGVGGGGGDWMELAQDRKTWRALVGTLRDFRVP